MEREPAECQIATLLEDMRRLLGRMLPDPSLQGSDLLLAMRAEVLDRAARVAPMAEHLASEALRRVSQRADQDAAYERAMGKLYGLAKDEET